MEPSVEWRTREPSPPLRGLISRYLGYRMAGFDPGTHRGLPSRHMTFIVGIGAPIDVRVQTNPAQPPARYRCVLSGLQASAAQISHDGSQEGVSIELSPVGCRALLGMPAAELWDLSLESSDAMGAAGDELWERLQDARGWAERFEICDRVLLGRLGRQVGGQRGRPSVAGDVGGDVARVWRRIVASGGTLTIGRLSAEAGYSRQHLARLFRAEFGLGPKLASRVMRFDRAQQALRSARFATLADAAVACGYADQAHLTREFVELAGCTPRGLLGGDLPILQEAAGPPSEAGLHDRF